jgi:alpha-1,6-mannosyltransferase
MHSVIFRNISPFRITRVQSVILGLGVLSGVLYLYNFRLESLIPGLQGKTSIHQFLYQFIPLCLLYIVSVIIVLSNVSFSDNGRGLVIITLLFGAVFRCFLVPTTPVLSDDIYRYVWDGRVQAKGINPYIHPPSAEELVPLRDEGIYANINRREHPTIYPAGAQLFFRFTYAFGGNSIYVFKGIMVFFDLLTMLVLLALLRAYGLPQSRLIIYAWNPLVIYEIAHSGHLEGLTVFLTVTALYLNAINRGTSAVLSLALAASTKLFPAFLFPAMVNRGERIRGMLIFFLCFAVLYIPYLSAAGRLSGFLPIYLSSPYEGFNLGLKHYIMKAFPALDYYFLTKIFLLCLMGAGIFVLFRKKPKGKDLRYAYILTGLLILLMPTALHPWYVVWLVPFLAFFPSPAWLLLSCTVALSYLKYVSPEGVVPVWVRSVEYVPLLVLLALGYVWRLYLSRVGPRSIKDVL